jgi:tRNA(fMet)-specific endonuclease VapC
MKYLYDADSVIDYLEDSAGARSTFQTLLPDGIAVTGITLIELYTGVYASPDPRFAERHLKAMLGVITTLRLNQRVIRQTAALRHDLLIRKLSIRRRAYDLITAATALAFDLTVVTSNTKDFQDIAGLHQFDPRTQQLVTH